MLENRVRIQFEFKLHFSPRRPTLCQKIGFEFELDFLAVSFRSRELLEIGFECGFFGGETRIGHNGRQSGQGSGTCRMGTRSGEEGRGRHALLALL